MRPRMTQSCTMWSDLLRADGTRLSLLEYASPLYDQNSRVRGCLGVMVDITPRKLAERRLALQYAVAHALAESTGVTEASVKVLKAVCEVTDSEFGALWRVDRAVGLLRNEGVWQSPSLGVNSFAAATRNVPFKLDEGLPGAVFSSGQPTWLGDMTKAVHAQRPLVRMDCTARLRAHSQSGEITGVLECFSAAGANPPRLINLLDAIGHQVGLFMEHKQAEDDLAVRAHQRKLIVAEVAARFVSHSAAGTVR
jgi:GAF domain-containing protein